jgi:maleate isomerase
MGPELLPDSSQHLLDELDGTAAPVAHVGVLVPWANTVIETELPLCGHGKVIWHYARLVPDDQATDDGFLAGLVHAVPAALHALSCLPLSALAVGCTSVGFGLPEGVHRLVAGARLPFFTAFEALVATLQRLSASRVVLLAPYPAELTRREAEAFAAAATSTRSAAPWPPPQRRSNTQD